MYHDLDNLNASMLGRELALKYNYKLPGCLIMTIEKHLRVSAFFEYLASLYPKACQWTRALLRAATSHSVYLDS